MTEYVLDNIKLSLQTYLESTLTALQIQAGSSIVTPTPQEYKIGEHDPNVLTTYPSILIWSPYSRKKSDQPGFQEREIWFRVLAWITENDLDNLHRFICRYSDGIGKVLREESYWKVNLHNPVIEDSNNTDQYQTNVGYAQGTLLEGTIDYILS